jgi:UDP-N-acetylmuramate dehydrogenase
MQSLVVREIKRMCQGTVRENETLSRHTTWGIGGPADVFVCPASQEELHTLLTFCKKNEVPYFVIGKGSNLLINDAGFRGVVISLRQLAQQVTISGHKAVANAGVPLRELLRAAMTAGLSGFECLCGVPGTVGGGLVTNAGAKGRAIGEQVESVTMINDNGAFIQIPRTELLFSYRASSLRGQGMICEAVFQLVPRPTEEIKVLVRTAMRERMARQPLREKTAGSVFKNPPDDFAGRLIETCGCKGWHEGDAEVSEKHANFIINKKHARASEVLRLMERVKTQVAQKTGIELEAEVEIVPA